MTRGWIAALLILIALLSWAGFWGLTLVLARERDAYAKEYQDRKAESVREESASRIRALVQGTEAERAALENVARVHVLRAVETIEEAGESAGVQSVSIGQATPGDAPEGLSAAQIVVNAAGSFASLSRALSFFEALPIPVVLEQFELTKPDQGGGWNLTAHLRVISGE